MKSWIATRVNYQRGDSFVSEGEEEACIAMVVDGPFHDRILAAVLSVDPTLNLGATMELPALSDPYWTTAAGQAAQAELVNFHTFHLRKGHSTGAVPWATIFAEIQALLALLLQLFPPTPAPATPAPVPAP